MTRRPWMALLLVTSTLSIVGVQAGSASGLQPPNFCQFGSKYVRSSAIRFEPGPPSFSLSIDNRRNRHPQVETWTVSSTHTVRKSRTYSGEVETSVSAGLKGLAEASVNAKFGHSRSTETEVSISVTQESQRTFPARTWGTWTKGVYVVTAKAIRKCRHPRRGWYVHGRDIQKWPVLSGWKWKTIAKGRPA